MQGGIQFCPGAAADVGATVPLTRADVVRGVEPSAALPEAGAAGFAFRAVVGSADESVASDELVVAVAAAAAVGSTVEVGSAEGGLYPSTLPTLVPC
jgi:hypothetical protein